MTREQIKQVLDENGFTYCTNEGETETYENKNTMFKLWGDKSIELIINDYDTMVRIIYPFDEISYFNICDDGFGEPGDTKLIRIKTINGILSGFNIK